jgi:RNA polymerase sigma-70 factor (ECF subfamily)
MCPKEKRMDVANESPDDGLVTKAQGALPGDYRAFEALVERHKRKVLANCRYLVGSEEDAEDLAQETFIKTYLALPSFGRRSSFRTWLLRIKTNLCLNHLRRRRSRGSTGVSLSDPAQARIDPGPGDAGSAEGDRIRAVLNALPETLRVPLVMRDMDGYSYRDIAEGLGIGLSAAKMRIKRAREEFRRRYVGETGAAERADRQPSMGGIR